MVNDNDALPEIHQQLSRSELLPDKHLADAGYVEAKRLVESQRDYGVELIGPVQDNGRRQHVQGNGFGIDHFQIDWEAKKATCPEGKLSSTWIPGRDNRGNNVINVMFAKADCSQCRSLSQCTNAKSKRRAINIKPQELHEALQQARKREKTEEFKKEYKKRSGIEGTISQGVRAFGMRRSRYTVTLRRRGIGKKSCPFWHRACLLKRRSSPIPERT